MKLGSVVVRPVVFLIVLSFAVLVLPAFLIPLWIRKVHRIENEATETIEHIHQGLLSSIDESALLLSQLNQSALNLRTIIRSSVVNRTDVPFSAIESEVAPKLFDALSTIPHVSQISYITLDGLYFSFYMNESRPFTVYSNNSTPLFLNSTEDYTLYTQPVYQESGKLYGEAMNISVSSLNITSCFKEALKSETVHSLLGTGFDNNQDHVLFNSIAIDKEKVLSIGFKMRPLIGFLTAGLSAFDGSLYLALEDGTMLNSGIQNIRIVPAGKSGSFQLLNSHDDLLGEISCQRREILEVENKKLMFYCSKLDFVGLHTVYVLAVPYKGLDSFIKQNIKSASIYLIVTMAAVLVTILALAFVAIGCVRREMHLCAALIKQMEATQQAERKSMNKSAALSSASHDIRTSLTGILGLLEICRAEVPPRSEIKMNLTQAETCANDLLGILNSILDASKIEAGKMQLDEEEFDLEQLLENTVDLFHPIAMKKGVDVLLEPYDLTFRKCSRVKGDSGKLKQILSNLLSNAVKFTYEGHISVKVVVQKPSFPNVILTPKWNTPVRFASSCFILPSEGSCSDFEVKSNFRFNEDLMEFIFEVNDTGKGIPKEKHGSVFENYIQVKDIAPGQEGTGLGLGIVQSLVRLMGGEIAIVDKETGEKGTCFRFNTFLTVCGNGTRSFHREDEINDSHSGQSPRFRSPKLESSHAILFVACYARSKMLQKHLESYGVRVYVVNHHEQLPQTLKMIKVSLLSSSNNNYCHNRVSDVSSRSSRSKQPLDMKTKSSSVLIVIDTSAGPFRDISRAVAEFRRDLSHAWIRVAWIDRPGVHSLHVQGLDADKLPLTDTIFSKPLHGSRLYQLIGLLPEFEDTSVAHRSRHESVHSQESRYHSSQNVSTKDTKPDFENRRKKILVAEDNVVLRKLATRQESVHSQESRHHSSENVSTKDKKPDFENRNNKPLVGKKILVAEDNAVLRKLATTVVSRLGAEIYTCQNGEEALELVCKHMKQGMHQILPFDYILMDCEMPIMNGYKATKLIREEEKKMSLHIPIIALTAHDTNEERNKMCEAGMDYYISKPLKEDKFLEAVFHFNQKL